MARCGVSDQWRFSMARKSVQKNVTQKQIDEAVEEFKEMCEVRYEIGKAAYDAQDAETQAVISRIRDRLRLAVTGYISVQIHPPHMGTVPVRVEPKFIDFNLLFVATEIVKDLAMFGIRVASYKFPDSLCTNCGATITKQQRPKRKRKARET